jgi:hypothetical protein
VAAAALAPRAARHRRGHAKMKNVMVIALNGGFGQRTNVADNQGVKGASTCHN